jgi:hypothetical protein
MNCVQKLALAMKGVNQNDYREEGKAKLKQGE